MKKTYIIISIDAETNLNRENGFWSYCVNGYLPPDLEEWKERRIISDGHCGYRIDKDKIHLLKEFRDFTIAPTGPLKLKSWDNAQGGLPLIYRSMAKYNAPCVTFLDIGGLYKFGRLEFAQSVQMTLDAGHELAMHVHPSSSSFPREWYLKRNISLPPQNGIYSEKWSKEVIRPFHEVITNDMEIMAGIRPHAYRAGAYRISDEIIDSLVDLDYRFDCSYDLLNRKGHVNIGHDLNIENNILPYRGLYEIPVSAFTLERDNKLRRFVIGRGKAKHRVKALEEMHNQGVRVITYILHSYSLMTRISSQNGENLSDGWGGADEQIICNFENDLDFITSHPGLEIITTRQLDKLITQDPTILEGSGIIPRIS